MYALNVLGQMLTPGGEKRIAFSLEGLMMQGDQIVVPGLTDEQIRALPEFQAKSRGSPPRSSWPVIPPPCKRTRLEPPDVRARTEGVIVVLSTATPVGRCRSISDPRDRGNKLPYGRGKPRDSTAPPAGA
jgi:hypothetical protein